MITRRVKNGLKAARAVAAIFAAAAVLLAATSAGAAVCNFVVATGTLAFGVLDPGVGTDVTMTAVVQFRCPGTPPRNFTITDDDGLYETGPNQNRMRNTVMPIEYLPYSFTYAPSAGAAAGGGVQILTLTGVVLGANYVNAMPGTYSDTVTLTILP